MITLIADAPESLTPSGPPRRPPLRVGVVQHRWREDRAELTRVLGDGIARAAAAGARAVFLPELTLLRYPGDEDPVTSGREGGRTNAGADFHIRCRMCPGAQHFHARVAV